MTLPCDVLSFDVLVVGDEVESILTAVSAARCGARTALIRSATGLLGGLSTRGGLSYMDITPEHTGPLFAEFLRRAGVKRVALEEFRADTELSEMMRETGIQILSGKDLIAEYRVSDSCWEVRFAGGQKLDATVLIDATPDADIARSLGIRFTVGLGGLFGEDRNFLGISPVFQMGGVDREKLIAFEQRLRERPDMPGLLDRALPYHPEAYRRELTTRPVYSPDDMDYIDILNPVIGIAFHHWRYGEADSYPDASIQVDGFNISRLPDGLLGFNGMVMRMNDFDALLAYSRGEKAWPQELHDALEAFREFIATEGGMPDARLYPPEALYVRQTLNLLARDMMTAEKAIRGGVFAEDAIGTYSYWLDLRGIVFSRHFPGETLPKPVFNVGLDVALPADPDLKNLAFVSRSAGYSPLGQGACRIVQHNSMLGEAVGIAAAFAVKENQPISEIPAAKVRPVLDERSRKELGHPLKIEGHPVWDEERILESRALKADNAIVERLQNAGVV